MKLRKDWKLFLKRARSVRVQVIGALVSLGTILVPAFYDAGRISIAYYAGVMSFFTMLTIVMQITQQRGFDENGRATEAADPDQAG